MNNLSRLDLYGIGRAHVIARAKRIDPAIIDTAGSDANLFIGSTSFMAAAVQRQVLANYAAHTLDGANGEDLDRLILDRTGGLLPRKGASPALVEVDISRASVVAGSGAVPVGTKLLANGGAEYVTTTQADFATTDTSKPANARAVQAGKETQVGANQIRRFKDAGLLFDPSLKVNNARPAAGGEPRQQDPEYREAYRAYLRASQRGILAAIEFGARTVPGVVSAKATEVLGQILTGGTYRIPPVPQPARIVTMFIADSSGIANTALAQAVLQALVEWRAAGIQVVVYAGLPTMVSIRLHLRFAAGVDTATLGELIRAAVFEFVNSLGVGEALEVGALAALLRRYRGSGLLSGQDSIVEPAGDLVPEPGRTIRVQLADVVLE